MFKPVTSKVNVPSMEEGVLAFWRFCTSAAHTEKDIHDTLERVEVSFKQMKS